MNLLLDTHTFIWAASDPTRLSPAARVACQDPANTQGFIVTPAMLAKNRKYAILGAFIAGAILTPTPDAFNQALMAGPLIVLYEIGIVSARIFGRRPKPAPVPTETSP